MPPPCKVTCVLALGLCASCSHTSVTPAKPPMEQVAANTSVASTDPPASGSVFVGCGFVVVENHGATNFTVLLAADHARAFPNGIEGAYILDNVALQTTSATARGMSAPTLRGHALLRKHMEWETQYLGARPGWIGLESPEIIRIDLNLPIPALAWVVKPTGRAEVLGQPIVGQLYVTAAIDDVVFSLVGAMRSPGEIEIVGPTFQRILKTLRRTSGPTDIFALSARLKSTHEPWAGCDKK